MEADSSRDTQPTLDTNALMRMAALRGACAAGLGLRFVFPRLQAGLLRPLAGTAALVIGREGDGCGRLEGSQLSRRHAELRLEGGALLIRDLDSRNGLFVNCQRRGEAVLRPHDVVRIGEWVAVAGPAGSGEEPGLSRPAEPFDLPADLHLGPVTRQLAQAARQFAVTEVSFIIEGETGTGKERFARAVHAWSGRKGPLVAINCAAVPEALAEAELFGHREGAFTGAHRSSPGHFRAAQGGTLFLDEVTDLPMAVQAKLLRALEQKEVLPVGESRAAPIDVRIIAATQVPLEQAVAQKRFRPDLLARLDGFTLRLPPLRDRREDIPSLFVHLLGRHGLAAPALSPRLVEALCAHGWPLNVRELNVLAQRLVVQHAGEPVLRWSHLPERIRIGAASSADHQSDREAQREVVAPVVTRAQLLAALGPAGGNLARAAKRLGISRQRAYRLLGEESPERFKAARRR